MKAILSILFLLVFASSCDFKPSRSNLEVMKEKILQRDLCAERNAYEWMVIDTGICFARKTKMKDSAIHYSAYDLGFADTSFIKRHLPQWSKPIYPEWWYDARIKDIEATSKDSTEAKIRKDEFNAKTYRYWVCLQMHGDSNAVVCEEMTWGNKYTLCEYVSYKRQRNTQNWVARPILKDTVSVDTL